MTAQPISPGPEPAAETAAPGPRPRVALNAFRHGLAGHVFVFAADEAAGYTQHCASIRDYYQPAGPLEKSLTDQIASGIWRLQRAMAIEEGIFAMDSALQPEPDETGLVTSNSIVGPTRTWLEQAKAFDLLTKYEGRIRRALDRDKNELAQLQQARKKEAAQTMNQAVALHNLAKLEKTDYEPDLYFAPHPISRESVFSKEAVRLESARREALAGAHARLAIMDRQVKKGDL